MHLGPKTREITKIIFLNTRDPPPYGGSEDRPNSEKTAQIQSDSYLNLTMPS